MPASSEGVRGSCLCGAVGFVITAPIVNMGYCHCSMCRRQHGSAFSIYCETSATGYRIERGADAIVHYVSSPGIERRFCGRCGSKLSYHAAVAPTQVWIAAGALDDDPGVRPSYHIFTGAKADWFEITDDLPQHAAFPAGEAHG